MSDPNASAPGEGKSKNARRRAAKKASLEAGGEKEPEPAPAPPAAKAAPKPKAKAAAQVPQAAEPAPKAKAKAKGKAKAEPAPAPAPAPVTPEPKAKAKAKAKSQPEPAKQEPPAPAPAPKAKAAPKSKAAAKPVVVEEEEVEEKKEDLINWVLDDGSGGAWETSAGMTKKQQKQKDRQDERKKLVAQFGKGAVQQQHVVGMGPAGLGQAANTAKIAAGANAGVAQILAMGTQNQAVEAAPVVACNSAYVKVPDDLVPNRMALIIGKGGAMITSLKEWTGAQDIITEGEGVTITGSKEAVQKAESAIREIVDKGYCSLAFSDFSENFVQVTKGNVPAIIGKKGVVVKKIKETLKVEVTFPKTSETAADTKKYKVMLAGSNAQVERAKQCINNIIMYGHDEITHPDFVHTEIECEPWCYPFIIGPKGSQLRHLQNNYDVTVSIPREGSPNENVLVIGEPIKVERAKACIENLLWKADNQVKGRDKVDATDVWGDEDELEPWMQAYMYKRT